jgi:Fe-S oxidoreductase
MEFSLIEQILFILVIVASVGYFSFEIYRRIRIVNAAEPDSEHESMGRRVNRFISEVLFQSKVIKDRPFFGFMHAFVFWGFIAYVIITINHFLKPFGLDYLHGGFGSGYRIAVVIFSIMVLIGIIALAIRRYFFTPDYFEKKSVLSAVVAGLIIILMVTFLAEYVFLEDSLLAKANWWVHSAAILTFLVVIPNSKHLHLVIGPFDLVYKRETFGYLPALNIEELDEDSVLGVGSAAHLSREMRMDAFSCVECGRCTEMCPANQSDKVLDPRAIIHNFEQPLLDGNTDDAFDTEIVNSEAVWQCVTCGACEEFCPLGIEHLPLIQQLRRNLTLEQGDVPGQMQNTLKALQIKQNVWNAEITDRERYIDELEMPVHEKGQMLIWSSCFLFTDTYRPIFKNFVDLLKKAGVEAGISPREVCCGDPARKTGGEDTFQELAMENIEWMKEAEVKTVISHCPHCLQTIHDGYKQVDPEFDVEVIHYTELLTRLVREGKLDYKKGSEKVTIHDPCYVSRWEIGDMEGLRVISNGASEKLEEMEWSRRNSFCCGSGGGAHHFFEDEDQKRIDTTRVNQIVGTGADACVVACPFCHNMVSEGLKMEDSQMKVTDISDMLE